MAELLFDFDNPSNAKRSLKRVAQAMFRAGQPVVSSDFDEKVRRTAGVSYRQALLTLASGQTVTLMVKLTGDVYRVLLNGASLPIKDQDGLKAVAEIAAAAERNQEKFQAAQARKQVDLPKGLRTAAPKMEQVLQDRLSELDAQICERTAARDALRSELGDAALDAVSGSLSDAATDVLLRLAGSDFALDDGDIPSKIGRDELVELGLVERDNGTNVLTDAGRKAAAECRSKVMDSASEPDGLLILADEEDERFEPADGQESLF